MDCIGVKTISWTPKGMDNVFVQREEEGHGYLYEALNEGFMRSERFDQLFFR